MSIPSPVVLEMLRAGLLLFTLIAFRLLNEFAPASCGITEVSIFRVPLLVIGPPVRSEPATDTGHGAGRYCCLRRNSMTNHSDFRICPLPQLVVKPRLVLPPKDTDPPPVNGLLAVTVKDEMRQHGVGHAAV